MPRTWRFHQYDEAQVDGLTQELRCSPLLARVLLARGFNQTDAAAEFLTAKLTDLHDPDLLPGAGDAAEKIIAAIESKRRITIYGDYDVDGVTSTSILWRCLTLAGANVDYYIPCRMEEGYGLNADAIRQLHEEDANRLLITVDCGISSVEHANLAKELGLELIITDHHNMADELPDAACLVHPRLPETDYPFGDLCGAGVAFKVAWAICQRLGDGKKASPRMREFLKEAVTFAAIGTIADVVPLTGENRVLVRFGLAALPAHSSPGLKALLQVCGLTGNREFSTEDVGFAISPRINAAGRLGQARLAVELLTTENPDRSQQLAAYLDQLNKQRQSVERKILKQAKELVAENDGWQDAAALVLSHPDWHPGVIGIVANRVAEHFQKPTVLVAMDEKHGVGQGSGRSFAGFDLYSGVSACSEFLETFGGHRAAIGLRVKQEAIDDFRTAFANFVGSHHEVTDTDLEIQIDAEVNLTELTHKAVTELDRLGPFGQANVRPTFSTTQIELAEEPRRMGGGDRHLSLKLRQYNRVIRAVAFGKGDWADELEQVGEPLAITFAPTINRFRGQESVEMQLIDWQPASQLNGQAAADATGSNEGDGNVVEQATPSTNA